jgi:DNA ligase D-like protein (predicted ligase)/DNA ligase D-like protein (predicted 3'-phosphoesterase)
MKLYKPMLARESEASFSSKDWLFEVKWDGVRAVSYIDSKLSIRTRNQKELLNKFPELSELNGLAKNVVLDGEIIVMKDGRPDFQTLLERNQMTLERDIEYTSKKFPATYVVFDILKKDGEELFDLPLVERKKILKDSVKEGDYVVLSVYVEGDGEAYYGEAISKGLEGVVAKKKQSKYLAGKRSGEWLKIKKINSCDCVIFGYTPGAGGRASGFGALVLGLYDEGKPVYVSKVGTGFSQKQIFGLKEKFKKLKSDVKTLDDSNLKEKVNWLKPYLVTEIAFQTVTKDGRLRMPRYRGLRDDKNPLDCTIDQIRPGDLGVYKQKRNFRKTSEPKGSVKTMDVEGNLEKSFVVHEHHARRLHYDLRLEREGVLKSWAIPKGPPEKSGDKRLAVQVEDHPLEYGKFEGTIPKGEYGAGEVKIWDRGLYEPLLWEDDKIELLISGDRLSGRYVLVKFKRAGEKNWLFFKAKE